MLAGICTKMVRMAPLFRLKTSSRRSDDRCTRSRRSSTTASSLGPDRDAKLLGEHAEDLGRTPQDFLDRGAVGVQLAAQDLLVL